MRVSARAALALALLLAAVAAGHAEPAVPRPNLLLIVVDDLGVNDLGAWGNTEVVTPNIDSLAARGLRFTRHYTDTTCATSRAMMLTGQEPARLGFRPVHQGISPEVVTLADALREQGYSTHHVGKWHLGYSTRLAWPLSQGFDTFFGFLDQHLLRGPHPPGTWQPGRPTHRNPWLQRDNQPPQATRGWLDDLLVREVEAFLHQRGRGSEQPWFLNLWLYAPHTPLQPMPGFAGRYPDTPRGRYLALLEQLDHHVGRVLSALEVAGLSGNTLVLLASDNGGTEKAYPSNAPFGGRKMDYREGAVRTPLILAWPGEVESGVVENTVTALDYLPTLLAAAGGSPEAGLRGRDLLKVRRDLAPPAEPLFWESASIAGNSWAVLSGDGRWRLSTFLNAYRQLNDLQADPAGRVNVMQQNPDRVRALTRQFRNWQRVTRELPLKIDRLDDSGKARVTGQSLQRAPGFAGHTFAIGLRGEGDGVLASQAGQWSLMRLGGQLHLRIHDHDLHSQPVAWQSGACDSLVLSSEFRFSLMLPETDVAELRLFVNGEAVLSERRLRPALPPDDFLQPLLIGHGETGPDFAGRLGQPLVYNRSVGILPADRQELDSELALLAERVCETT